MSAKNHVIQKILSLENLIVSHQNDHSDPLVLDRFNQFIENLKGIGLIEGMGQNHQKARYFLFEGASWQKVCQEFKKTITPNFIMWEEAEFYSFLETLINTPDQLKSVSPIKK
jgi:hypothetical protein